MTGFSPDVAELRATLIKMTTDLASIAILVDPRVTGRVRSRIQDNFRDLIAKVPNDELAKSLDKAFRDIDTLLSGPKEDLVRGKKAGGANDARRQPSRRK